MKEDRYIEFDKYLNNEFSNEEKISFEDQLKSDKDFSQEFNIYKSLIVSLASKFENEGKEKELKKTLSNLGSQFIKNNNSLEKSKVISLLNYKTLMVAASIALLIGFFLFNNGDPVYSDFAKHSNLELVVRSENNATISKAEKAFNSKNYTTAFAQLTILEEQFPNDTEIKLYKGICLLELDKFSQAQTMFNLISNGNSVFKTKAIWYKALVYLKQDKLIECKTILETIPEDAQEYEQAKKLIRKL